MGMIREQGANILVIFGPVEIISERIGFKENTVAYLGSAIAFCAREKLKSTRLADIPIGATKIEFKDGCFIVTLQKLKGTNENRGTEEN